MAKQLFKLFTFFFISYITVSCSEQDLPDIPGNSDNTDQGIAVIDQSEINAEGGGFIIRIKTVGAWQAKSSATWCTLNQTSGNGNSSITGYLQANTGAKRNVTITIEAGKESATLVLTQTGSNGGTSSNYSGRIEIPKLKGGNMNLFITHTTTVNGKELPTFSIEYDCTQKSARWSACTFSTATPDNDAGRGDRFTEDPKIPVQYQTSYSDYTNSGYSRGHLVASSDRQYSEEANLQTFYMSNINPQIQNGFNGGIWANLEKCVQKWGTITNDQDTLYAVKGGTIDQQGNIIKYLKENNTIPVPKYFYMAILSLKGGEYHAIGFWFEHKSYEKGESYKSYAISIDKLEEYTGIDFFHNLPDNIENTVEANYKESDWSWN